MLVAALVGAWLAPTAFAQNVLPALGDRESDDLSIGTERKVGDYIMRDIRRDPDYVDDPVLLEYLQSLFEPLLAAARKRGEVSPDIDQRFAWEPFLVRDRTINAFALPGGYMGVHLGLIGLTDTRDELASVLAHEMTHVTQRHIARSIGNSKRANLLSIATLLAGVVAAGRTHNADMANAAIAFGQAGAIQGQLNFSRDMEREADRIGFAVMTSAGFAPRGMAAMFEKMGQSARLNDNGGFPYLRTHPLTSERIGEAKSRMGSAAPAPAVGVLEHAAAQARARVLMDVRVDALRHWQQLDPDQAASPHDKLVAAYEAALASTLLRDWARADWALQKAQSLVRGNARAERAVALLTAQSMQERGDAQRAADAMKALEKEHTRPVQLLNARIALVGASDQDDFTLVKRSADALQSRVAVTPSDAESWNVLAQLWGRSGQKLRAVRAESEARYALGDLPGAIDRLRAGQRMARTERGVDFIDASVIDARLRAIEAERREIELDEKRGGL